MKITGNGYFWAFPARVSRVPFICRLQEPATSGGIRQKRSPLHEAWMRAPPTPFVSPVVHLRLVATLLGTLFKALVTNIAILFRKMSFRHVSLHFLSTCVSDVCNGIDKVSMKGDAHQGDVYQAVKKLTSMVCSTDCKFLEHDVPSQPHLISSQRSEPCLLS